MGGTHGGVGPSTDDDVLLGFGGSEAPGLGSGGGGFGGGSGSGPIANVRGRQNGLSMSFTAAMDGQGPPGGQHTDDWAYRRGSGDGVRSPRWNGPSRVPEERTLHILLFTRYTSSTHAFVTIHPLLFFIPQRSFCKRGNSLCFVALVLELLCSSYEFFYESHYYSNSHSATLDTHDMPHLKITFLCPLHQDKY